jgi:hypothetical protein
MDSEASAFGRVIGIAHPQDLAADQAHPLAAAWNHDLMMHTDRYGDGGNMRRIAGAWWEQDFHDRIGVFFGKTFGRIASTKQLGARLTPDEQHTLIALHEVAHVAANHGLGLALGPVELLTDAPEQLGDGTLVRLGKTAWAEREPRAAWETAITAMAGWAANQLWLDEFGQMDEYTLWHVQLAVIADHDWLLNVPTLAPTAYLYGTDQVPEHWSGQPLDMDAVVQQAKHLIRYRWTDIVRLSAELERQQALTAEAVIEVLGEPGWARPYRVRVPKGEKRGEAKVAERVAPKTAHPASCAAPRRPMPSGGGLADFLKRDPTSIEIAVCQSRGVPDIHSAEQPITRTPANISRI